jgi:hypothetical protein
MGGSAKYRVFWIQGYVNSRERFDLEHDSSLEATLIALLENCRLKADVEPGSFSTPTPEARKWLVDRIRNRSLKFATCP